MGGLMAVVPFLGVAYVIAGLASLGLPGLSGFVAEMTIFFGSFQHPDTFHRVATIIATSSIVITAVYILRVVGKLLLGQLKEKEYLEFPDAKWYERISLVVLIVPIAMIGFYPTFLSSTVMDALNPIVERLTAML